MAKIRKQNSTLDLLGQDIPELKDDGLFELYKKDVMQDDDSDVIAIFSYGSEKKNTDEGEQDLLEFIKTNKESSVYDNIWDTSSKDEEVTENTEKEEELSPLSQERAEESFALINELTELFDDTDVREEMMEEVCEETSSKESSKTEEAISEDAVLKEDAPIEPVKEEVLKTEPAVFIKEETALEKSEEIIKTEPAQNTAEPVLIKTASEEPVVKIEEEIPFTSADDIALSLLEEKETEKEVIEEPSAEETKEESVSLPSDLLPPPVFDIKSEIEMIEAESFDMSEETLDILEKPSLSDIHVEIPKPSAKEEEKPSEALKEKMEELPAVKKKRGMDFLSVIGIICAIAALVVFGFAGMLFFGSGNTTIEDTPEENVADIVEETPLKAGGETAYAYLDESQNKTLREWQTVSSDVDRVLKIYGREFPLVYDGMKEYYAQRDIYRNADPAGTPSIYKGTQYVIRTKYLDSDEDLMFDFIPNYLDTSVYRKFPLITLISESSTDYYLIVALVNISEDEDWYQGECDPNEYVAYVQDNASFIFSPEIDAEAEYVNIIAEGLGQMLVAKLV